MEGQLLICIASLRIEPLKSNLDVRVQQITLSTFKKLGIWLLLVKLFDVKFLLRVCKSSLLIVNNYLELNYCISTWNICEIC